MKRRFFYALAVIKAVLLVSWLATGYLDGRAVAETAPSAGAVDAHKEPAAKAVAPSGTRPDAVEKGLFEAIQRRDAELDSWEERLRAREDRLEKLKRDIEARVGELKDILAENEAIVKRLEKANSERIQKTVKIYESMEPEEAATRLEGVTEQTAVLILSGMKAKKAGAVLGLVEVDKAVKLTHLLKLKKD